MALPWPAMEVSAIIAAMPTIRRPNRFAIVGLLDAAGIFDKLPSIMARSRLPPVSRPSRCVRRSKFQDMAELRPVHRNATGGCMIENNPQGPGAYPNSQRHKNV